MRRIVFPATLSLVLSLLMGCQNPTQSVPDNGIADAIAPIARAISSADFLKTNGKNIRNNSGNGTVIALRGTNAGGWLVQEGWMNPTNAPDQKIMMNTLSARFGTAVRDSLIKTYEDNYWTLADFDNCRAMGMNVIRLPFTYMNLLDSGGNLLPNAWNRLDWFVSNAGARGMYVILDLHGAPGSQNGADHSGDTSGANLWNSAANLDKTVWLWQQIAAHFNGNPTVAAYDLLNEPTGGAGGLTNSMQWNFYDRLYDAVRAIDPNHIIMMESCWEPAHLPNPASYGWTNVVYQYHNYCWGADNDYNVQTAFTNSKINAVNAANYNVPTFVGEFTVFSNLPAWHYTLSQYNAQGWSWTTWTYKVTGTNNNWGLYNHNPAKVDIYNDSAATIQNKWSTVGSSVKNTALADVVSSYLPGSITTPPPATNIALRASANNQYVCAENAGSSPLVANRAAASGWETFTLVTNADGSVSLKSLANNMYVCADNAGASPLIANRASVGGAWESFDRIDNGDGTISLRSRANNRYVAADLNLGGVLIANRTAIGTWEKFTIVNM